MTGPFETRRQAPNGEESRSAEASKAVITSSGTPKPTTRINASVQPARAGYEDVISHAAWANSP